MSLSIITSYFDPTGSSIRSKNWKLWRSSVSHLGVPVVSVELSFNNAFHTLSEIKLVGGKNNIMWQKEAMLNIAVKSLPPEIDRVIWVDADVVFDDDNWIQKVDDSLDENALVQCFSNIRLLNQNMDAEKVVPSAVNSHKNGLKEHRPGFALAARREVIEKGLYAKHIAGTGDVCLLYAAIGLFCCPWAMRQGESLRKDWLYWGAGMYQKTKGRVGYVENMASHLWHGKPESYPVREQFLAESGYCPTSHVELDEQGLLSWTDAAPEPIKTESFETFVRRENV